MSRQKTEQEPAEQTSDQGLGEIPFPQFGPLELLQASNLMYERDNVALRYGDKAKDWQIKGLSKLPDQMDKYFTQRQAAGKKALGFLEGAFGGGFRWGGRWVMWLMITLIVIGGYAYLNANPDLWVGFGQWVSAGANGYYLTALVAFSLIVVVYIVVRFRRRSRT